MIDELDRLRGAPQGPRSAQGSAGASEQRSAPTAVHEAQSNAGAFAVEWGSPGSSDVDER